MANASSTSTIPPPPAGLNYIASLEPSITLLMIGTVWSSMLIPLLIILFAFSSSSIRRRPLFGLNVTAVLLGIILGIINGYLAVTFHPLHACSPLLPCFPPLTPIKQSIFVAFAAILLCLPVFMDTILIFRVFMVYPPHTMAWPRRLVIFGPPIMFKILRVANLIVFLVKWTKIVTESLDPVVAGQAAWGSLPWTKIEWFI
ncbi:hypothetical protein MSAN_01563700 [Mycena sanguinolenta]|uniref:Uncharacterized protein n=1 Tax=Mycena sanguinolenta TaxID=230812 RepID=A0A8H6Y3X7_9AGAR|nr:hypothetical protein MSAN_01563700 [Mycena sanguinolenta]